MERRAFLESRTGLGVRVPHIQHGKIISAVIDGKEVTVSGNFKNFEEVIHSLSQAYEKEGRIIWSVMLNGDHFSENYPHESQNIGLNDIQSLEIRTMDQKDLFMDFLKNSGGILSVHQQSAREIADDFRLGKLKEAINNYIELLQAYRDLIYMLQQCQVVLGINLDQIQFHGISMMTKLDSLSQLFDEMIRAQENEDWILLSDLLEFELVPLFDDWMQLLPMIESETKAGTLH
jgi:hypothetical protein